MNFRNRTKDLILAFCLTAIPAAHAATVEYNLTIANTSLNISGKPSTGITVNGGIPGPVLHFTEGDLARIHVTNEMQESASIHWHGMLVPNSMDGVPNLTFPPIQPGATFTYEFPIRQAGTYWYHSHSALQEQSGVYGPIVIDPRGGDSRYAGLPEHVVMLSDWTDENPEEVLRTLRSGNEYYSLRKRTSQSILGAYRAEHLKDYFMRELQRMPAMDLADVAYDRFLTNGHPEDHLSAKPGERVRLRIVDGGASTFFHVEFAGGPMTIIAADGQDVEPVEVPRLLIGMAETYDVLVTVPSDGKFELRATAQDRSGRTSLWLGDGEEHSAPMVPAPNLYMTMGKPTLKEIFALTPAGVMGMPDEKVNAGTFDKPGMHMGGMDMEGMERKGGMKMADGEKKMDMGGMKMDGMDMAGMEMGPKGMSDKPGEHQMHSGESGAMRTMPKEKMGAPMPLMVEPPSPFDWMAGDISSQAPLAMDGSEKRPPAPYAKLRATHSTAFDASKPLHEVRLTLDGDMERYIWFINSQPLSANAAIRIKQGEVVRFIMINRTMMHHPMHLHGHFFRVMNGQGDFSPSKHTVDVAPMSTTVIEFDANEKGDWFFHCHLLYHMMAGMAKTVEYESFEPDPATQAVRSKLFHDPYYVYGVAEVASNMSEGWIEASNTRNIFRAQWEIGWNSVPDVEWEGITTYGRYINRFTTLFVGADLLGEKSSLDDSRGILGISYTLPFNFHSRTWVDSDGGARVALMREFMLTPRLSLETEVEYDTHLRWEGLTALNYAVAKHAALQVRWNSDYKWGAGLRILF
ncbi:MAG: multicopper oxidase domain-containing protein [Opitutaceae bacterium]